jgi:hypothetical protein
MKIHDITVSDLTSVILEVRSYFAKRGIYVRLTKKPQHFTTGPNLPIVVKDAPDTRGLPNGNTRLPFFEAESPYSETAGRQSDRAERGRLPPSPLG